MIDPLQPGLSQSAGGANSLVSTKRDGLGLNPADKKKHHSPYASKISKNISHFFGVAMIRNYETPKF